MIANVLLFASLATMQSTPDYWPDVSCNMYGTVFDSVWEHNVNTSSPQIYHQRNTNGTGPSDSNATALPTYTLPGSTSNKIAESAFTPTATVDTDDSSRTNPNFAAAWCVSYTTPESSITIPVCCVNGFEPFPVGSYEGTQQQATAAWVAVTRKLTMYNNQPAMAVVVAYQNARAYVYAQAFVVNPSNGAVFTQSAPAQVSASAEYIDIYLGGIAADDWGNFIVTYVEYDSPASVYAAGFNYTTLFNNPPTLGLPQFQVASLGTTTDYMFSRVACYHGSSEESGGFVIAWGGQEITARATPRRGAARPR